MHSRLREHEQRLSQAISVYASGQGARPETLMKEVEHMRAECALRFKTLMDAVTAQRSNAPR